MPKSTIYTGTGDTGKTGLANRQRIDKQSQRINAIGAVDELNAIIGVVLASGNQGSKSQKCLIDVQNQLFVIGAMLAQAKKSHLSPEAIENIEQAIDNFDSELPKMTHFILPGGSLAGALLHQARTVCRRGEREVLHLAGEEKVESDILVYLNRLSDLLFVLARHVNQAAGEKEYKWNP